MCYSPITIKNSRTGKYQQVPCGKCLECLNKYQQEWEIRMAEEYKSWSGVATMVTFTYNEQSVPKNYLYKGKVYRSAPVYNYENIEEQEGKKGGKKILKQNPWEPVYAYDKTTGEEVLEYGLPEDINGIVDFKWEKKNYSVDSSVLHAYDNNYAISFNSVRKEDITFYLKKYRKETNANFSIFLTSEYGPSTFRPHYHAVFFGLTPNDLKPLTDSWKKHMGEQCVINQVYDGGSFNYVSKYCSKGSFENPFCAKNFFYPHEDGTYTEYHSQYYERCIQFFGIDAPICDKTFHTISKGIGQSYVKNSDNKKFHTRCNKNSDGSYNIDRIITNKKYVFTNGRKVSLPKYYYEKIVPSHLRAQVSQTLQSRYAQLFEDELQIMVSENFARTPIEVAHEFFQIKGNPELLQERYKKSFERMNKKYKQSQI